VESYRSWAVWIERSDDHGVTWTKFGPITVPSELAGPGVDGDAPPEVPGSSDWKFTEGIIQPCIVPLGDRHLRLFARSTSRIGKVCIADSLDDGRTWSQARPIEVPNPNSGIDAVTLPGGKVVLIYNHTDCGRTPLNLAVSHDGEHFRMAHVLEDQPGEYSYPAMIQGGNKELHITYTWNRTRIRYVRVPWEGLS
jgi:predicted neuraminidase